MNISETPDRWVIIKILEDNKIFYKVYGTWAGWNLIVLDFQVYFLLFYFQVDLD